MGGDRGAADACWLNQLSAKCTGDCVDAEQSDGYRERRYDRVEKQFEEGFERPPRRAVINLKREGDAFRTCPEPDQPADQKSWNIKPLRGEAAPKEGEREGDNNGCQAKKKEVAVSHVNTWREREAATIEIAFNHAKRPHAVKGHQDPAPN